MKDDIAENAPFLWVIAIAVWIALIFGSFYNDDSPIQVRYDCPAQVEHPRFGECHMRLVWVRA